MTNPSPIPFYWTFGTRDIAYRAHVRELLEAENNGQPVTVSDVSNAIIAYALIERIPDALSELDTRPSFDMSVET